MRAQWSQLWLHLTTFYGSGFHPDLMLMKRRIAVNTSGGSGAVPIKRSRSASLTCWKPRRATNSTTGPKTRARGLRSLLMVLDQFSRSAYRGTARAYAQDAKALALAIEGIDNGHYGRIPTMGEKTFFILPLAHSEQLAMHERTVALCEALIAEAPEHLRRIYVFSASQARGHREVIARFGRHPHRNAVLGRTSSEEERAYIAEGQFVHRRTIKI